MHMRVFPAALVSLFAGFALISAPASQADGKHKPKASKAPKAEDKDQSDAKDSKDKDSKDKDQPKADDKTPAPEAYKPTNDIEEIAWKHGTKALKPELDRLQERCGFTIPVEIVYAAPMKTWVAAEEWGLHRGCSEDAQRGGCVNLSWCGADIVSSLWFNFCGNTGEGVRTDYKGWNTKVKRLVCRGEAPVPGTSRMDSKYSKMKASLSSDGTLTVTLHPSDSNVSNNFYDWLEPRIRAD
jgi:hypothetical protein